LMKSDGNYGKRTPAVAGWQAGLLHSEKPHGDATMIDLLIE
jgi:hypothetical protein